MASPRRARHAHATWSSDERFADASFFAPEGDALRVWHPDYDRAVRDEPLLMPEVTKQASGAWLKSSIELGFIERTSMLIEGTWRDPAVPLSTLAQARQVGYRTHAVLVAVPPEVSRVEMLARFYEPALNGDPARWTPPSAHDEAVANLEDTAVALAHSEDVDTFSVVTREAVFRRRPRARRPAPRADHHRRSRAGTRGVLGAEVTKRVARPSRHLLRGSSALDVRNARRDRRLGNCSTTMCRPSNGSTRTYASLKPVAAHGGLKRPGFGSDSSEGESDHAQEVRPAVA